jgi:hypothetical protein
MSPHSRTITSTESRAVHCRWSCSRTRIGKPRNQHEYPCDSGRYLTDIEPRLRRTFTKTRCQRTRDKVRQQNLMEATAGRRPVISSYPAFSQAYWRLVPGVCCKRSPTEKPIRALWLPLRGSASEHPGSVVRGAEGLHEARALHAFCYRVEAPNLEAAAST